MSTLLKFMVVSTILAVAASQEGRTFGPIFGAIAHGVGHLLLDGVGEPHAHFGRPHYPGGGYYGGGYYGGGGYGLGGYGGGYGGGYHRPGFPGFRDAPTDYDY